MTKELELFDKVSRIIESDSIDRSDTMDVIEDIKQSEPLLWQQFIRIMSSYQSSIALRIAKNRQKEIQFPE